jgi:hypothetical protein
MAITKEFRCLAHGAFDSKTGVCPRGCTTVIREFRTAPGIRQKGTKQIDKTLEGLASRFGLSDMSNRNGESVGENRRKQNPQNDMAPTWGPIPKGNVFQVGKGEVQVDGATGGAMAATANMRAGDAAVNALAQQQGVTLPTFMDMAGALPKIKPIIVGKFGTSADLQKATESS